MTVTGTAVAGFPTESPAFHRVGACIPASPLLFSESCNEVNAPGK
jgi:hypothetical protein